MQMQVFPFIFEASLCLKQHFKSVAFGTFWLIELIRIFLNKLTPAIKHQRSTSTQRGLLNANL